jgi:hypothetical protein
MGRNRKSLKVQSQHNKTPLNVRELCARDGEPDPESDKLLEADFPGEILFRASGWQLFATEIGYERRPQNELLSSAR